MTFLMGTEREYVVSLLTVPTIVIVWSNRLDGCDQT
jgi:hypothetical protein